MNINFKIKEKIEQVYFDIFIITKKRKINFAFEDSSDEEIESTKMYKSSIYHLIYFLKKKVMK